jgi:hypothetical protein
MNQERSNPSNKAVSAQSGQLEEDANLANVVEQRLHQRFACAVKVSVEVPFVPTLGLVARDLSRHGMRLDFTDEQLAMRAFDDNLIGAGCDLTIRCSVRLAGTRHKCHVNAKIVRLTPHGIAVEFGDHSPWQLMKLVDMFARHHPEPVVAKAQE